MNNIVRTIVTFQSNKFNTTKPMEPPIPSGDFGQDVCKWMIERLTTTGISTKGPYMEGPCNWLKDDRGIWSAVFSIEKQNHQFQCGFRAAANGRPAIWVARVLLSPPADWLSKWTLVIGHGDKLDNIDPAATSAIHRILSAESGISNIQWHCATNFDGDDEDIADAP